MELRVLGPIEVRHDGSAMSVRGSKPRQLLALLTIRPNRPVSADQLVDELWEGSPPPSAATALRVHVRRLRQVLEIDRDRNEPSTRLPLSRNGYVLRVETDELDAERFERLVLLAREANASGDPARAVPQLTEALDLWRGDALIDIADLSAARAEIARLDELRAVAFEELADARLTLGEHAMVVDLARSAIARYPLREQLTSTLMLALYRSGRQAEALQACADSVERLAELGLTPSRDLRRLEGDILLQSTSLDARARRAIPATVRSRAPIGRFVGRRHELSSLIQAVESGDPEGPRLMLVAGEAGVGKTTLIEEFCAHARQCGVDPIVGRCTQDSSASYQPVIDILRQLIQPIERDRRATLPAELGLLVPDLVEARGNPDAETDGSQYRLFEAIVATLRRLGTQRRVLIVEDLHWADRPTLRLLRHVARHQELDGMIMVATMRDDDVDGQRAEAIEHLARSSRRVRFTLSGFDDHEVRALVRATASPETLGALIESSATLHDVTHGNPLFLRELLREIDEDSGALDGGALADTLSTIAPVGVRALVDRRSARLTEGARNIVDAASVFGHDIEVGSLARICGLSRDAALEGLEEALATRLLVEDYSRVDHYWFSHALVRNAVYAAIPDTDRRGLHLRAARELQRAMSSADDSRATELAYHYREAAPLGHDADAAYYAEAAGDEAAARTAFSEAVRWYEQTVELHQRAGTAADSLGQLHLAHGRALINDKQHAPALATLSVAADCARRTSDHELLAAVALTADNPWALGADFQPDVLALLEEALDAIGDSSPALRVRLLEGIATNLYYIDADREGEAATAALQLAEDVGGPTELATAHRAIHLWLTHQPEARAERLSAARRAHHLERAARDNAAPRRLVAHRSFIADLLENQELAEFEEALNSYEKLAEVLGSPADIYWAMALRAMQATMRGDLTLAEQLARGALLRGHELDQISDGAYFLQNFVIRYQQARLAEEIPSLAAAGEVETVYRAGAALHAVGCCETGYPERGLQIARRVLGPDAGGLQKDAFWLAGMSLFAGVATAAGDTTLAVLLLPLLESCADHVVLFGACAAMLGCGHHWLGGLRATLGDRDAALGHYREAASISRRVQAPYWEAQAQIDAAALLVDSTSPAEGELLRREAVTKAERFGYQRIVKQARAIR
jgi:DNA-binding SARP family transcriptional activator